MSEEMTWIAPVYLRILMDRAAGNPEPSDDVARTNEALEYAAKALDGKVPPPEPKDPALPPGEYATVHIMGHDYETGWVTDGIRAGVPVLVIRDWDGRVLREVPGQSLYQFVPLATPLKRPEPQPSITAGVGHELTRDEADAWCELRDDDDGSDPF